ncbi:NAD(P)-binding domain-containing protein, partial [Vibrio parahaemolyticus]|uniref:NAD(P)-binding domain-containing protein n=1 Tax=Vibrio parahaemolyticus TaxID=670 RepID=UPI00182FD3D5
DQLKQLIESGQAKIGVIGLGYVGLPLVVEFARKGFSGIGFEVEQKKIDGINRGESHIVDVRAEDVRDCVNTGKLVATGDFSRLTQCDAIIICVPTPLRKTKDPDMSFIISAGEEIKR